MTDIPHIIIFASILSYNPFDGPTKKSIENYEIFRLITFYPRCSSLCMGM